jgi:1-carboxybiuret hydrolase subunit AtzG-like protein
VDQLDTYARAAARLAGLEIDDAWWPGVERHLTVLLDNAALVEAVDLPSLRAATARATALGAEDRADSSGAQNGADSLGTQAGGPS